MEGIILEISPSIHEAFATFNKNASLLALPLISSNGTLQPLPSVHYPESTSSFQVALNEIKAVLDPKTPMYLLLRRNNTLIAITFAPYLADSAQRQFLLEHRHEFVQQLGAEHFSQSLICKEIGEITDARSWNERDLECETKDQPAVHGKGVKCEEDGCTSCTVKDAGYKRTKCRLCDRRMQNPIAPDALEALRNVSTPGALVQITVDPTSQTLTLLLSSQNVLADQLPSHLPPIIPTFNFYTHSSTSLLYFISHCPDSAPVKARMTHTMAIPGLLVHAEDVGVKADRTMEIHDVGDAVFEEQDGGVEGDGGKERFRSVYRREGFVGTELGYTGLERDREFADGVRQCS